MIKMNDVPTILSQNPYQLWQWLEENFNKVLPLPTSSQEFAQHKHLLGELANTYCFLNSLHALAGIQVREAQKAKKPKEVIDECRARRDTIEAFVKNVAQQYNAFSRMITVQKQADDELRMLGEQ